MFCEICKNEIKIDPANFVVNHLKRIHNISSEEYYLTYLNKSKGKCLECGNFTEFLSIQFGYRQFCCRKCSNISKIRTNKIVKTLKNKSKEEKDEIELKKQKTKLLKHNDPYFNNREKAEKTCLERYGEKTCMTYGSNSFKNQMFLKYGIENPGLFGSELNKEAMILKYGVDHPGKMENFNLNLKKSLFERYGDENYNNKEQIKETMFERYGGFTLQSSYLKNKVEETMFERYGVINSGCIENNIKKYYKWKDYILPSNKTIRIQGYENYALDILLKFYNEEDILTNNKEIFNKIGKIEYFFDNKKRIYVPDIFIISENKIIEVKSTYTFEKEKEKNLLKRKYTLLKGHSFEFIIFEGGLYENYKDYEKSN